MSNSRWQLRGDYFETCNCDYVCPCVPSQMQAQPTKGECIFAMAFRINDGNFVMRPCFCTLIIKKWLSSFLGLLLALPLALKLGWR